ncbi:MAG: lantibiotic dehydratase family protein [Chloroflexi bacterium]|nr:lantibiotic dehydratase family protein [Chloroflexota bacterium]
MEEGGAAHSHEIARARTNLCELAKDDALQKGLLLSSHNLLTNAIPRYVRNASHASRKPDPQTERNILKYVSRMYAKTSPFSTFTPLSIMNLRDTIHLSLNEDPSNVQQHDLSPWHLESRIRLNNAIGQYLTGLLAKHPSISGTFLLRPNPSLSKKRDCYVYLVNVNNVESFQHLAANPVLELLIQLMSAKGEGVTYRDLVEILAQDDCVSASRQELQAYLNRLIELGFLEIDVGVSALNPDWDIRLTERLRQIDSDSTELHDVVALLNDIRCMADRYSVAGIQLRAQILEEVYSRLKEICSRLRDATEPALVHKECASEESHGAEMDQDTRLAPSPKTEVFTRKTETRFYFTPERILFEDTRTRHAPEIDPLQLEQIVVALNDLFQEAMRFEYHQDAHDEMLAYFLRKYGTTASVDLLTFYEDYYRDFKKPETERLRQERHARAKCSLGVGHDDISEQISKLCDRSNLNPRIVEREQRNRRWLQQLTAIVKSRNSEIQCEEIRLKREHFEMTNELLSCAATNDRRSSHDVFMQFYKEQQADGSDRLIGVFNGHFPGFGKMMSRFLYLFDPTVTTELREWIDSMNHNELFVEGCDSSVFNANMHPTLFRLETRVPGGQNSLPPNQQVPATELHISVTPSGNQLQLIHLPSGNRVYIFDIGLQALGARSQLYQLLEQFTLAKVPTWNKLIDALTGFPEYKDNSENLPRIIPRIVYENIIVLQRKAWHFPKTFIPIKGGAESDWSYFVRINQWRIEQSIPEEVFAYVATIAEMEDTGLDPTKSINPDDRKPQYISFRNPLLVNLFDTLAKKAATKLIIVEMLPSSNQLLQIDNRRCATEFLIEWYSA